jgi:hypothetical protein
MATREMDFFYRLKGLQGQYSSVSLKGKQIAQACFIGGYVVKSSS